MRVSKSTKKKSEKFSYIRVENFCSSKDTKQWKKAGHRREETFATHITKKKNLHPEY